MSLKKKLGMGIMSGALGLTLIGGGTWAAFNDVETVSNTFASGTLDLGIGYTDAHFKISNLKPGDTFSEALTLTNDGSLDINQIFLHSVYVENSWKDYDKLNLNSKVGAGAGNNTLEDFLQQFSVTVTNSSNTSVFAGTLQDLVAAVGTQSIELTGTPADVVGLPAGNGLETYTFHVEFVEDGETFPGSRLHKQNRFQGEGATLNFVFEATQMPGEAR
ncbi:TasA family protein [Bacillus horti]|uniref:Spore coat-associated protein N n=1 Tax=Caldalkalibacillus horti TaxID=77523 RepID=A0ABT9W4E1_9BACI|nr:TasA family protein [Bacillus horti]MDQ0167990.1 spore coat-associated protein N [Bacillus horti]